MLSQFDGRQWRADFDTLPASRFAPTQTTPIAGLQVLGEPLRYDITLEAHQHPWLLVLDATPQAPALPDGWRAQATAAPKSTHHTGFRPVLMFYSAIYDL